MNEYEKFLEWTNQNVEAALFLLGVGQISQKIDDLIDEDRPELIIDIVANLIAIMGNNTFFVANSYSLSSIMLSSLTMWAASNKFSKSDNEVTQMYGFVYREALEQIIPFVSILCGNTVEEAVDVAGKVHQYYHQEIKQDTFGSWIKEINNG